MRPLLYQAVNKNPITDEHIAAELLVICCEVHSSCHTNCPVYATNYCSIPYNKDLTECACFRDGSAMLEFLRKNKR